MWRTGPTDGQFFSRGLARAMNLGAPEMPTQRSRVSIRLQRHFVSFSEAIIHRTESKPFNLVLPQHRGCSSLKIGDQLLVCLSLRCQRV